MIVKNPSIFIYTNHPDQRLLGEVCAGIEEEGVFFEVFERGTGDIDALAYEAANDSMMGSGIGMDQNQVALQMKGIPKGKNVEFYEMPDEAQCRKIGANSARAIKKMPFKS